MPSDTLPKEGATEFASPLADRRKRPRFCMQLAVVARGIGGPWMQGQTCDVSAVGAVLVTGRPFLVNAAIEYVVIFPSELTKAAQPLRMRFFGKVLRCVRVPDTGGSFRVAVRNSAHRYLTREEAIIIGAVEHELSSSSSAVDSD